MNHWNDASDFRSSGRSSSGRGAQGRDFFERWSERTRLYLKSRTADHWLMFIAGLLLGALLA